MSRFLALIVMHNLEVRKAFIYEGEAFKMLKENKEIAKIVNYSNNQEAFLINEGSEIAWKSIKEQENVSK